MYKAHMDLLDSQYNYYHRLTYDIINSLLIFLSDFN